MSVTSIATDVPSLSPFTPVPSELRSIGPVFALQHTPSEPLIKHLASLWMDFCTRTSKHRAGTAVLLGDVWHLPRRRLASGPP